MLTFEVCWFACWLVFTLIYRQRTRGCHRIPARGPLLVVANHQSHLDPPAIGMAFRTRHLSFLARDSLFRVPLLGRLIRALNSTPVARGTSDTAAIRTTLALLAHGRAVLVFPEGTRSTDGSLGPFKRGVWLLLSRAKCPVLPVAISGSNKAWPRASLLPRLLSPPITVHVGQPIPAEALLALGPDAGLARIRAEIESLLNSRVP
ncbi:MAG: lysophospholipid acyltransferase family protein [Phycisphaerales bacterium]